MNRASLIVLAGYGSWVLFAVFITIFRIGDAGVSAHLGLLFTGFPLSLLSLWLPNGTILGVLGAGALGLIQWLGVTKFFSTQRGG
ncbi:MAG: hypothetical protein LBE62_08995 [Azonexus sp.]|jgi:hypothetical protein|nr:hypothetical protein [Azonexus sp.]